MNRPKIIKQTVKEPEGDLWSKHSSRKQITNNNENDDTVSPAVEQTDAMDVEATQEEGIEMSM